MKKILFPLTAAMAVLFHLMLPQSCANTTQSPSGGKKDTIPPYIVDIKPLPGAVGVPLQGSSIVFTFNEFFTVKNKQNIVLSPPQSKAPNSKIKGKNLILTFQEPLSPNTTYTIEFTDAIADNNEGNMYPGYTYVFSTGSRIDSMVMTGVVRDCSTLKAVKGATVLLYKDLADSAVLLHRPDAAIKTDDWGFFTLPYIADTTYRIYAIKDANNDFIYQPESETVAFIDSILRPKMRIVDSLPELMKYDMTDTLMCEARRKEHSLNLFRENPSKQYVMNKVRVSDRTSYITFMAPNVWIDSLWIKGYRSDEVITQFNISQDSLVIWLNNRKPVPDTLHLFVNYRKTDTAGILKPSLEHIKLSLENGKKTISSTSRRKLKHEDTICVYHLDAKPENIEQSGFELTFNEPIIFEDFGSIRFKYLNPKQKEFTSKLKIEKDTLNLLRYILRPVEKLMPGYEYFIKIPKNTFRDINGYGNDSTEVKVSLPSDDKLSTLEVKMMEVDRKLIVDLLDESRKESLRQYIISSDETLRFPYLKEGKYSIRITDDSNDNSIVDTGCLLEHRQPERVVFYSVDGNEYIDIPSGAEVEQEIRLKDIIK